MPEISEAEVEQQLRRAVIIRKRIVDTAHSPREEFDGDLVMPTNAKSDVSALAWLDWLDADDAALVQARIHGARWKLISWRFGISRATAHRRWRRSLRSIARRLQEDRL